MEARLHQLKERAVQALELLPETPQEIVQAIQGYTSVGALAGFATSPLWAWLLSNEVVLWLAAILSVLGIARHHSNIGRLLKGEESRLGRKSAG